MHRVHLFEFGDQTWFPKSLRNYATDYLETLFARTGIYAPVVPRIGRLLRGAGTSRITDLGSGAGGPLLSLAEPLAKEQSGLRIRLTDKWPNAAAFERAERVSNGVIVADPAPVDMFAPGASLEGLRTMFDALHHFKPADVRRIFERAAADGAPIAVFDAASRTPAMILGAIFIPIVVWVMTPLIRPFRWTRLLLTYLIPILPLLIFWDGLVSHLRAHTADELRELVQGIGGDRYRWEVGEEQSGPGTITYVIGQPAALASVPSDASTTLRRAASRTEP